MLKPCLTKIVINAWMAETCEKYIYIQISCFVCNFSALRESKILRR